MRLDLFSSLFSRLLMLTLLTVTLQSCVGDKKPSSKANCPEGQGFDAVSRQCISIRVAPATTLKNVTLMQGSGRSTIRLDYRDVNGEEATSCRVTLPGGAGNVEVNSPLVYDIGPDALTVLVRIENLATSIVPTDVIAIAAATTARNDYNELLKAETLPLLMAYRDAILDRGADVVQRARLSSNSAILSSANVLEAMLNSFEEKYAHVSNRCYCELGECFTVATPKPNFHGNSTFNYRVSNAIDGESDLAQVNVEVLKVNRRPLPAHQQASIVESRTDTASNLSLSTLLTPSDPDGDMVFTYQLVSGPTQGTLSQCLGLNGNWGTTCLYRPNDGNRSDVSTGNFGVVAQATLQGISLEAPQAGTGPNGTRVRLVAYQGLGFAPVGTVSMTSDSNGAIVEVVVSPASTTRSQVRTWLDNSTLIDDFVITTGVTAGATLVSVGEATLSGGANAQDSFTYRVSDTMGNSVYEGVYSIRIIEQDDYPVIDMASAGPTTTPQEDLTFTFRFDYTDSDTAVGTAVESCDVVPADPTKLTVIVACFCSGTGSCQASLRGTTHFNGTTSVNFRVRNGGLWSDTVAGMNSKSIAISAINDAPVLDWGGVSTTNSINEDDELILSNTNIRVHTGDYPTNLEINQNVSIRLVSSNTAVIPNNADNLKIFYDGQDIGFDGTNFITIPKSSSSVRDFPIGFRIIPAPEMSTTPGPPVTITVEMLDSGSGAGLNQNFSSTTFTVEVVEVNDPPTISTLTNIQMNEGGVALSEPIYVDEGGGPGEDSQTISVRIFSDNPLLLPDDQIEIFYDLNDDLKPGSGAEFLGLGSSSNYRALNDGANSADLHALYFRVRPAEGESGTANLTVNVRDSGAEVITENFAVIVHPVSATHGGWSHLSAVSNKTFRSGISNPHKVCPFSTDQCRPNGNPGSPLGSCTGTVAPNSSTYANTMGSIYSDTANNRCYYNTAQGATTWQEINTFCPISKTADVPDCSVEGASCIGSRNPTNIINPNGTTARYYYNVNTETCYRSTGPLVADWEVYFPSKVTLTWKNFQLAGTGADAGALINGWNIYRRKTNEAYNFSQPLNASPLNVSTRTYVDTSATAQTVYYYVVQPIDSIRNLPTATREVFSEVRILTPPPNMVTAHRWMINQEVCERMLVPASQIESVNNFRCAYAGPGETITAGNITYYDIGMDILVDVAEAGCPYSVKSQDAIDSCGLNGCIGIGDPNVIANAPTATDLFFYDRSTATCYKADGGAWSEVEDIVGTITQASGLSNLTQQVMLPPLVNLSQSSAHTMCARRDTLKAAAMEGIDTNLAFRLPRRKEQIAYSAHPVGMTDLNIDQMERGLSLNTSSKCNSSQASGLEFGFTNTSVPSSSFSFSLPGTQSSGIRSIHTGSIPVGSSTSTQSCVSRYGVQDAFGNVAEWVSDRFNCAGNICTGLSGGAGGFMPGSRIDMQNNDMNVFDTIFAGYAMDGMRGPCRDIDANGVCNGSDAPLTSWKIQEKSFEASYFSLPLGLPIHRLYPINYTSSTVSDSLLEIGPTSGITISQLHNDAITVNAQNIEAAAGNLGAMATGGGFTSGDEAGRYNFELIPTADVASAAASGVLSSGAGTINLTAITSGAAGNDIQISLIDGGTSGSEDIIISGSSITVRIEDGVSTANTIRTRLINDPVAQFMVNATVGVNGAMDVTDGVRLSGGQDEVSRRREDIGFRCIAPVAPADYENDSFHTYSY